MLIFLRIAGRLRETPFTGRAVVPVRPYFPAVYGRLASFPGVTIAATLIPRPVRRTKMTTNSNTGGYVISSDKVEGTAVFNGSGDKLGSIDDLMIDKRTGHVRYAVLEFGGFLGIGSDRYPIPWNVLRYDTSKDGYVVPLDKNNLENAPRYQLDDTPTYDSAYGTRVDSYYSKFG
jgi:sporulation protein YlmC with PRC-barrel domain